MRIFIIGGTGIIGKYVAKRFSREQEVIIGSRNGNGVYIDISQSASIKEAFDTVGQIDAIINIADEAKWDAFTSLKEEDYYIGIRSKMMGQVNVTRIGLNYLKEGGSITLSTGILADEPVIKTASAAMVNGAIHSFVKAASLEMLDQKRLNVVSSGLVEASVEKYKDYFPGHYPIPMDKMLAGYVKAVMGHMNGEVIRVYQ